MLDACQVFLFLPLLSLSQLLKARLLTGPLRRCNATDCGELSLMCKELAKNLIRDNLYAAKDG